MNKVQNGTRDTTRPALCESCRAALVIKGSRAGDDRTYCQQTIGSQRVGPVAMHVVQCSGYDDKRLPSRWDMEQIAWFITTSPNRKLGFISPTQRNFQAGNSPPSNG